MCDKNCNGCDDCIPSGPMGPQGPKGDPGKNGTNGRGVLNTFVSNGVTPINDVIYPVNTLVVQYSDLTYAASGVISIPAIEWLPITLLNGWTNGTGALAAMYAIFGGFLHLRGRISFDAATEDQFATIDTAGNTGTIFTTGTTDRANADLALDQEGLIQLAVGGAISLVGADTELDGDRLMLDSIPPISIR